MVKMCVEPYPSNSKYESHFELYPYPLSSFQKYAIEGIIHENNVLITAHTGSGKTLPAEFAIQHFVKRGKKVIYTSPIKALSNQKFYEFSIKYPEISFGLLTGDIKTNPTADVLIMTTEILMNYLFNQNCETKGNLDFQIHIESELGCVIFDEVHYINDEHRGQTWEQTILMLPAKIPMVMLSATIDNPIGFAEWIEQREGSNPVYLASTDHRVVPLTHYGFFATTEKPFKEIKNKEVQAKIRAATNRLILLKTAEGQFTEKGYAELKSMTELFDTHRFFMKRKFVLNRLAEYLKENEMLPAIVFVFSRKAVEQCAEEMTTNLLEDDSKVPYIIQRECDQIIRKFSNYREYLELPEYVSLVKLLEKGIGIHHSGMIPVLREIVELMISKKYIKLLFATESFAIGLDCPIKTAVFSALRKFDGSAIRDLMPHEYTQMAGRAGRRGIDTVGHVVHCNNLFDLPQINEYKVVLCGSPQQLSSKFKITYSTVLNLMKSGQHANYHTFVEKTMLKKQLESAVIESRATVEDTRVESKKREFYLEQMRTPREICDEYMSLERDFSMFSNKKKKECDRKMKNMKEQYKWLAEDVHQMKEHEKTGQRLKSAEKELEYIENYSKIQMNKMCGILLSRGFIIPTCEPEEKGYNLTRLGTIAANIHEIHPLIGSQLFVCLSETPVYAKEIAVLLSVFIDIKVPDEYRRNSPSEGYLKSTFEKISGWAEEYDTVETAENTRTGFRYDRLLQYDLTEDIEEWFGCETEEQCKYFIQKIKDKISVGDFTKAVLKIIVIANEFISICEEIGNIDLLSKLKMIEPAIRKYIATSQSLYI